MDGLHEDIGDSPSVEERFDNGEYAAWLDLLHEIRQQDQQESEAA